MKGVNGRKAMVYNETFPINVTITKLRDMGQYITAFVLRNATRRVPSPSEGNESCQAVAPVDIASKTQLDWASPSLSAVLHLHMDESVVCDIPRRGRCVITVRVCGAVLVSFFFSECSVLASIQAQLSPTSA